ncbi:MAG: outer membrane lipoprotein-sorting protein [Verrucomicrobia bacterium]|nr:outer membrane lipoprotein-sorting protein [Verrucomicrobiota bacterium]
MKTQLTFFWPLLFAASLPGQAPTADEIAGKSQQAFSYAGQDMVARVVMTLVTARGEQRVRDLTLLRRNADAGRQKYFLYFHSPADVRGTAFLVGKEPGRDADRWLFIPAINLVQRIAARDAESSFVGSDFSYEDVSGRPLPADSRKLLREESLNGRACYVVESVPKTRASFTRKLAWIDRANFLPLKEEYFDAQQALFRVFTADEVRDADGLPTVTRRTMKNVKSGHRTEVVFKQVKYNAGLGEDVFTERALRRPPAPWISGD